ATGCALTGDSVDVGPADPERAGLSGAVRVSESLVMGAISCTSAKQNFAVRPSQKAVAACCCLPAIGASRGSFWAFGLPFISSAFAESPNHSTRAPLFVIKHLSPRTGMIFRISYF